MMDQSPNTQKGWIQLCLKPDTLVFAVPAANYLPCFGLSQSEMGLCYLLTRKFYSTSHMMWSSSSRKPSLPNIQAARGFDRVQLFQVGHFHC